MFGGILIALLLAPVFLAAVLMSFILQGSPVFFTQDRIGQNLSVVRVRKIRTMSRDTDFMHDKILSENFRRGGTYDHEHSSERLLPLGRLLRRWSIDEYPQLYNVVVWGNMGLVGPRPMLPAEVSFLTDSQIDRFKVKPGLVGLAQVKGRKNLTSEESLELDSRYAIEKSFTLNFNILLKSIWVVVRGTGAR